MRTRIKGLVAVVIASAAIGGALAAPASADPPILELQYRCLSGGSAIGPATFVSTSGPVHQFLRDLRHDICDPGTLGYIITKR
jgi:hypothetical protein